MINFSSDNVTGASPEIIAALVAANHGTAMPYGNDEYTQRLETKLSELFETQVTVFPVGTGTAANAIALSVISPSFGAIYCHAKSHINLDECGAPEFYTGGAKLVSIPGEQQKIQVTDLAEVLNQAGSGVPHHVQPAAVSITQATEAGTVYTLAEIRQIAELTHAHHLKLHLDGARFANAVVSLGCTPADLTWKAGVDVLSFGASKNGAIAAEAIVFFDRSLTETVKYRRKRGGHLFAKMRFFSAQLEAYLTDNLWLNNASHANQMATQLAAGLISLPEVKLCYPVEANEIFVQLPEKIIQGLLADGFQFYNWPENGENVIRLVTAFNTKVEDIYAFITSAKKYSTSI